MVMNHRSDPGDTKKLKKYSEHLSQSQRHLIIGDNRHYPHQVYNTQNGPSYESLLL